MRYDVDNVLLSLLLHWLYISRALLIIVAGIKLAWNVISGDVVSVKKIYVLFTIGGGGLYGMKLCLGSFVTVSLSYETRPFIGTIRRINWIGKEHMVENFNGTFNAIPNDFEGSVFR